MSGRERDWPSVSLANMQLYGPALSVAIYELLRRARHLESVHEPTTAELLREAADELEALRAAVIIEGEL